MARPKKTADERQVKKIVVYTTAETKERFQAIAESSHTSESTLGELAIQSWLRQKGGSLMDYPESSFHGDLTGQLRGADMIMERTVDVPFSCKLETEDGVENWNGTVTRFVTHGSHYEFQVQSRGSGFKVIAGPTLSGWFLALPVHEVCLDLAAPDDVFYNKEKALSCTHVNRVDGISAVYALKALYSEGIVQ